MPTYVLHFPIVIAISALVVASPFDTSTKLVINVALGVGVSALVAAAAIRLPGIAAVVGAQHARHGQTRPAVVPLRSVEPI